MTSRKPAAMNPGSEFPFDRARRVTPEENQRFKSAIETQLGIQLRDRAVKRNQK